MTQPRHDAPPQAPEGGLIRRLLGPFYVTGVFWYRFHRWGVQVLPRWGVGICLTLFTSFFFVVLVRIRRAVANNLEVVLGPCSWLERQRRIYRTLWNFAWCLSERYEQLSTDRQVRVEADGAMIWEHLLASGRGFVMVSAHVGSWEVGVLHSRTTRKVHVVREEELDPEAQSLVHRMLDERGMDGVTFHFVNTQSPDLACGLMAALRRGEIVALQGDRPRTRGRAISTEFFRHRLGLPAGPAALARAAEVPLLPVFVFREGRLRVRVVFREPIHVRKSTDRAEDLREAVRSIAAEVEWAVSERPFQWFCFRDLWGRRSNETRSARLDVPVGGGSEASDQQPMSFEGQ